MREPDDRSGAGSLEDIRLRQNNILPPDIIRNDRETDDVLWHGPRNGSKVQRAGSIVIGGTLSAISLALTITELQRGEAVILIPMGVIGAFGLRILIKAFRPTIR